MPIGGIRHGNGEIKGYSSPVTGGFLEGDLAVHTPESNRATDSDTSGGSRPQTILKENIFRKTESGPCSGRAKDGALSAGIDDEWNGSQHRLVW